MDCPDVTFSDNTEFMLSFSRRVTSRRIPLSVSIEFTRRCNLSCVHCYCDDRDGNLDGTDKREEMSTGQLRKVLDEIAEAGCLFLCVSGGEPLSRPDFPELYRYAKEKGFYVSIFTNATLIDDEIIDLFRELPPYFVDISVYGATPDTYERVAGVKGSFQRCMDGITRLRDAGIPYKLKTMLLTLNQHEIEEIEEIARKDDVYFRMDPAVNACLNGSCAPLKYRVPADDAIDIELASDERSALWHKCYKLRTPLNDKTRLYACGAGVSGFHVDPYGMLTSCVIGTEFQYDLKTEPLAEGWDLLGKWIKGKAVPDSHECNNCEKRFFCTWCPAFSQLENIDSSAPCEYLCKLAEARRARLLRNGADQEMARGAEK